MCYTESMTETTAPTFVLSTKPREGGRKLAITVEANGLKTTKVTARTYTYLVVSMRISNWRWDQKSQKMLNEPNLIVQIEKGTGDMQVAKRKFAQLSNSREHAVILYGSGKGYGIFKSTSQVTSAVAA